MSNTAQAAKPASMSTTAQPFTVPSFTAGAAAQQNRQIAEPSNLSLSSTEFKKSAPAAGQPAQPANPPATAQQPTSTTPQNPPPQPSINTAASTFIPTPTTMNPNVQHFKPTTPATSAKPTFYTQQEILQAYVRDISERIAKAKKDSAKLRLEDVLENYDIVKATDPNGDTQEKIKFICNNTGKDNFEAKMKELKVIMFKEVDNKKKLVHANLQWFVHYILIRRIDTSTQKLQPIFIQLINGLQVKKALNEVVSQTVELFKKSMCVDEQALSEVAARSGGVSSPLINYLKGLGGFMGLITLAKNKPIPSREIDLKRLLYESYT